MFGTSEDTTTYDVMDEEQVARIQKQILRSSIPVVLIWD